MEVLIALVVLSVGLLGLAALQAEGLRGSSSAQMRFQAVSLMRDITDRMRANSAGLANYVVTTSGTGSSTTPCVETGGTAATDCTAAEMAAYDLFLWKRELSDLLRSTSTGAITLVATAGTTNRYQIVITWVERADTRTITNSVQF